MKVEVKLFGPLRPFATTATVGVELPDGALVRDAREAVAAALGAAARPLVARSAIATEDEVLPDDAPLPAGARQLAVLPPVCGG